MKKMAATSSDQRTNQKRRTRAALIRAARELVAQGRTPTLEEVAEMALVSRATAYRYFPSREFLLMEVPLDEQTATVQSLFGAGGPETPEDRAALVQNALYDVARDNEPEFRMFLRAALTRSLERRDQDREPIRGARRAALLAAALEPLRDELSPTELDRLRKAAAILVGVESMVVLRDVLGLDHDEAREVGEWAIRQLVGAARHDADRARSG